MIHVALRGIEATLGVVLTYLVHSTAWIVGALLLTRFCRVLSPAARHVVWRAALFGPLVSSAFALALGHRWQWSFGANPAGDASAAAVPHAIALRPLPLASLLERAGDAGSQAASFEVPATPISSFPWSSALALCWGAVALASVLLLARSVVQQRRLLAGRTAVTDAASIEALERLARRAGLRRHILLSCCARVSSPLVLSSREICLPERARELDSARLVAALAHEVAHIERRDGLWLYGALGLSALLWFQPLNRKARAELRESAELAADDRAVELTGDPLGLARTLADVASWLRPELPGPSLAMARAGSPIVERVARLVAASDSGAVPRASSRTPWFALAALAAIGACSPSVGAPQSSAPGAAHPRGELRSGPAVVPVVASNPAPRVDPTEPNAPLVAAAAAPSADDAADAQDVTPEPSARERRADAPRGKAKVPDAAAGQGAPPPFPINQLVGEVVASVVPNAVAFSQSAAKLARAEADLEEQIRRAELAARAPRPAVDRAELDRLRRELAQVKANLARLESDFESGMEAWSKTFEERFDREFAPRFEAWGEDLGRRMQIMSEDLTRQLGGLSSMPIPPLSPRVSASPRRQNVPPLPSVPVPPNVRTPPNVQAPPSVPSVPPLPSVPGSPDMQAPPSPPSVPAPPSVPSRPSSPPPTGK